MRWIFSAIFVFPAGCTSEDGSAILLELHFSLLPYERPCHTNGLCHCLNCDVCVVVCASFQALSRQRRVDVMQNEFSITPYSSFSHWPVGRSVCSPMDVPCPMSYGSLAMCDYTAVEKQHGNATNTPKMPPRSPSGLIHIGC